MFLLIFIERRKHSKFLCVCCNLLYGFVLCCAVLYYAVFAVLCFVFCHVITRKWNMSFWSAVQVIAAGEFEYAVNRIF